MQQIDARVVVHVVYSSGQTSEMLCKAGHCRGVGKCSSYGLRVTSFLAPILVVACEQVHLVYIARHGSGFSLLFNVTVEQCFLQLEKMRGWSWCCFVCQ